VIRDRIALYRENDEGLIENVYLIKIMNMGDTAHEFSLSASGITDLQLDAGRNIIRAAPGEVIELPVRLTADPTDLTKRSTKVQFFLSATDDEKLKAEEDARFLGPAGGRQ
jgi:polyferredoxin